MFRNFGVMPSEIDEQDADDFISIFLLSVKEAAKEEKKTGKKESAQSDATIENTPPHLWALYGLR